MDNENNFSSQPTNNLNNETGPVFQQPVSSENIPTTEFNRTDKAKRLFFQTMLVCLIASAGIAVVAVLIGSFNETLSRALGTIALVILHAIFGFSYISASDKQRQSSEGYKTEVFSNTAFTLIVASFITSIFAVWQLLDGVIALKLFLFYGVLLFATLHAEVLYRLTNYDKNTDMVVKINYLFMSVVVGLLLVSIFSINSFDLGDFFYRLLSAMAIIDATLSITAIIMHKLYLQKHPELAASLNQQNESKSKSIWRNPFVVIILLFLALQFLGGILSFLFRSV